MPKLQRADEYYLASGGDLELQKSLIKYADDLEEWYRDEIWQTYMDQELASEYRSLRAFSSLHNKGMTQNKSMREIVRIPAGAVYQFLKDIFEPLYGPKWMREKKALRHELVRPWWVVEKI